MPTLEVEGFRLTINSRNERGHRPHVHVIKAGTKVLVTLNAALMPYRVAGMKRQDIVRARELVGKNFGQLMDWWIEFNG